MKGKILVCTLILVMSGCKKIEKEAVKCSIGGKVYYLQYVSSPKEMAKGLKGRKGLLTTEGMIFDFKKAQMFGVTMRGCELSLCVFTLTDGFRVKEVVNMNPTSPDYYFKYPACYMVEINPCSNILPGMKLTPLYPEKDVAYGRLIGPDKTIKKVGMYRPIGAGKRQGEGLSRFRCPE